MDRSGGRTGATERTAADGAPARPTGPPSPAGASRLRASLRRIWPAPDGDAVRWLHRVGTVVQRGRPGLRRRLTTLRGADALQVAGAGLVGALPVLWVLGAVPWRLPTLLIETMFRGFVACALDDGVLNPLEMVCNRAGVPLGMHQLDGGLSYPLGGLLIGLGIEPLAAWRVSVALLVVPGFAALYWLLRHMTGSAVAAGGFVALHGLSGTMTARSWNWYWNLTAVALLPVLFAVLYALFERAGRRRLGPLIPPAGGALLTVLAISLEWQYAGLFATAVAVGALAVLIAQRGWTSRERLEMVIGTACVLATVFVVLRDRLATAGIAGQFRDTLLTAAHRSIDLLAFVAPDGRASLVGALLDRLGADGVLARTVVDGPQLWVTPYLGVLTLLFLAGLVVRRGRPTHDPGPPAGYLPLLGLVVAGSVILSIGPAIRVSWLTAPTLWAASPLAPLWESTPLQWIRYPWTWGYLTHLALLLLYAALTPALRRRSGSWSPLAWVLAAVLALDLVSPQAIAAFDSDLPSVETAPRWTRFDRDHPGVGRFEAEAVPELVDRLGSSDGPVVLLPWTNAWTIPHLGPATGIDVRNTGIDRNVNQAEAAAPFTRSELRDPTPDTVRRMLDGGWVSGVALLDLMPRTGADIVRRDHQHPRPADLAWWGFVRRTGNQLAREGYCVDPGSWFTIIRRCPLTDLPSHAARLRDGPATPPGDEARLPSNVSVTPDDSLRGTRLGEDVVASDATVAQYSTNAPVEGRQHHSELLRSRASGPPSGTIGRHCRRAA